MAEQRVSDGRLAFIEEAIPAFRTGSDDVLDLIADLRAAREENRQLRDVLSKLVDWTELVDPDDCEPECPHDVAKRLLGGGSGA